MIREFSEMSMAFLLASTVTVDAKQPDTIKRIDWYTERCGWGNNSACDEALTFATRTHSELVDGLMPCCSMLLIDCKTGVLQHPVEDYNFSAYTPFLAAGKTVRVTLAGTDGMAACCASATDCPMLEKVDILAQQLLTLALRYNLTGYTGDWEWPGPREFYWEGWNATMAQIASVLTPHGIGLGNGVVSQCAGLDVCSNANSKQADPCCCPAYRNTPWADVLSDMGSYSILSNPPTWHGPGRPCPHDPNNDPSIIQYCGWEGGVMNMLHSPAVTVYADRSPQVAPAIWVGDCAGNGSYTKQGWTQPKLHAFLAFLDTHQISRIGVWCMTNEGDPIGFPCNVSECPWMLDELLDWKKKVKPAHV